MGMGECDETNVYVSVEKLLAIRHHWQMANDGYMYSIIH